MIVPPGDEPVSWTLRALSKPRSMSNRFATVTAAPRLLADGLVFGEGPRWRDGRLWFSDMRGEAVHTLTLDARLETAVALPGREPSGLGWLPDGSLLIVSMQEPE